MGKKRSSAAPSHESRVVARLRSVERSKKRAQHFKGVVMYFEEQYGLARLPEFQVNEDQRYIDFVDMNGLRYYPATGSMSEYGPDKKRISHGKWAPEHAVVKIQLISIEQRRTEYGRVYRSALAQLVDSKLSGDIANVYAKGAELMSIIAKILKDDTELAILGEVILSDWEDTLFMVLKRAERIVTREERGEPQRT